MFALIAVFGISLAAQEIPDANASSERRLTGTVRTAEGIPVPGATLRAIQTSSGKAWVSWTDENGKFEFPALPSGHYRIELSQLGFAPTTREIDLAPASQAPLELKLDVGTLAGINAPPATQGMAKAPSANPPPSSETAKSQPSGEGPANPTKPPSAGTAATSKGGPASPGGRPGGRNRGQQGGPGGGGPGGGQRAFQQVGLNGQDQNNPESMGEEQQDVPEAGGQLGQAASADAVQMMGTVAMGQTQDQMGGFGQPGGGGPGGPGTEGAFGNTGIPGQTAQGPTPGMGGRGGFGGRGGGGRGPGQRGVPRGPQGIDALMGAQRLLRQRINRVHYSFYDTFGDSALNARPYSLTERTPLKIPGWTESAGFNMGGPLKIPHVYDGTDKTFFYINFGGTWSRTPVDSFAAVPTATERMGDFSANNVQLYNPASNLTGPRTLMPNAGCQQDLANAPGTCIPQSMISQQALGLLNYIPPPNVPCPTTPNMPCPTLNYHLQTNLPGLSNRLNVNVTHRISSKLSLQVNYNLSNGTSHFLNSFPGIQGNTFTRGQSVMIGLTQNWTKTFMHTSQFYFSRSRSLGLNEFSNLTDISSQLGITGVSTAPFDYGLPMINLTNFTSLSDPNPSLNRSQTYRYVDSVRWMKAKHTINIGGEIRKMDINRDTDPTPNGQFSFTGLMTSQLTAAGTPVTSPANCGAANPAVPCIGNDFADFLLGYPANTKVQFGNTSTYFRNWGFVGYGSDDWHMFPRFTVTYGVRYEAFTPPTEINNRIANLEVSSDFTQVQCVTPVPTGTCIAGPTASLFHGHYNNWAPRLGIAWQPPGKWFAGQHQMTVRAGYSMFYVQSYLNTLSSEMANQPPFAVANTLVTLAGTTTPLTLQNGLSGTPTNAATNTVAVDPNYKVPYAMIWNASIEYNLVRDTFVEMLYTGTRGVHLDELLGFTPPNATGFTYDTSGAFSNFNALQVRLQKRMSHGLMFMARYTFSKSLDDASTIGGGGQTVIQNNACPRCDYGLSSFNMTHQFFGRFSYQLPFGDRQRFATKGWQKSVFGAWRVNSTFTANSGTPYTVRIFSKNPSCQNVPGVNSERADQTGDVTLANPTVQEWFNTLAFSAPTGCFGNAARNSVVGPGAFTINSGLTKTIQFGRDGLRRLDFSWNTTNLLNHVNYSGLSTVFGTPTFGQITGAGAMRSMTFTTRVNF
ncbi:MAG: carboxypeptidase regulatory-like domain-containing protein [Acidobacteriia bacterium]|nr:carboxypeptidase regulatory-like domain-containing protein [Terriglobia bacterium]